MHRIDRLHMEFPFAGSRMPKGLLVREGFSVGRLHAATLMKGMRDVYVVVKQRIACSPPDRQQLMTTKTLLVLMSAVLGSAIGVVNAARWWASQGGSHIQSTQCKILFHAIADRPTDHAPRI